MLWPCSLLTIIFFLFCVMFLDTTIPTPHYNASVLSDMFLEQHLHHLYKCITDFPGMKDAVALIKVWLHQRELDQVLAFSASILHFVL